MSEIKVSIRDQKTLVLEEDGKKGDTIGLAKITSIDNTFLSSLIEKEMDTKIKNLINENLKNKENELKAFYGNELNKKELEINELKNKINLLDSSKESEIKIKENEIKESLRKQFEDKITSLNSEKETISKDFEIYKRTQEAKFNQEKNDLKIQLEKTINDLINKKSNLEKAKEQEIELVRLRTENAFKDEIKAKDDTISNQKSQIEKLSLAKSSLNIKKLGEQLENWAKDEYENYALSGFSNCQFYKDNQSIKEEDETSGTKADFIFKSFADDQYKEDELLTSVCLEMKNESNTSVNKKKNSDHYAKLDKDRNKKNCEYALLVSELEWNNDNDAPIKKVKEFENMYVVRPQYFVAFLSLVNVLALKYREILLKANKEEIEFKQKKDIIEEFNHLKSTYLEAYTNKINKKILDIRGNAEKIISTATQIIDDTNKVINDYINDIQNKIERFDIIKLSKKIDKIEG